MFRGILLLLATVPFVAAAEGRIAGTLSTTRGGHAEPVRYSLVFVKGFTSPPPAALAREIQAARMFDPPVLAVVKGQAVEFANQEPSGFWHHVFSPSPLNTFDLGRYRAPEKRRQVFYQEGRVDIFCDIHKEMFSTLWVLPNASFALLKGPATASTPFALEHVPAGRHTVVAWNRAASAPVQLAVTVENGKTTVLNIALELGERPLEALLGSHLDAHGHPYTNKNRSKETGDW